MLKSALKKQPDIAEFENIKPTLSIKKIVKISSECDIKMMTPVKTPILFPRKVPVNKNISESPISEKCKITDLPKKVFIPSTPKVEIVVNPMMPQKIPLTEEIIRQKQRRDDYNYMKNTNTVSRIPNKSDSSTKIRMYSKSEQISRSKYTNLKGMDKIKKKFDFSDEDYINETSASHLKKDKENITYNIPQNPEINLPHKIVAQEFDLDNLFVKHDIDLPSVCFTPSHNSTFISAVTKEISPIRIISNMEFDKRKDISRDTSRSLSHILEGQSIIASLQDDTFPDVTSTKKTCCADIVLSNNILLKSCNEQNNEAYILSTKENEFVSLPTNDFPIKKFKYLYEDEEIELMCKKLDECYFD